MNLRANGIEIHYALDGPPGAPVVTLSHSIAADLTMWDPTVPALTPRYRVLRYDIRGHGGSEAAPARGSTTCSRAGSRRDSPRPTPASWRRPWR